jgi:hypothetical protein
MFFQFFKKISFLAIAGIGVIFIGAIVASVTLKKNFSRALVDYVPEGADFWLWGAETVFKTDAKDFLKIFSIDEPSISELAMRDQGFVIYSKDNRWYKLVTKDKFQNSPSHLDNLFLDQQYREGKNALIGFVGAGYIKAKLSAIMEFIPQSSYYFTVFTDPNSNGVDFLLIPSEQSKSSLDLFSPLPAARQSLIFALITNDAVLHNGAGTLIKEKIREYAAFENPITVSSVLPDGSIFKERIVDPTLFTWRQDESGINTIIVDENERLRLYNPKEIGDISFPLQYYESSDRLFLGSNIEELKESALEFGDAKNLMYFSFTESNGFLFVDIMGKSDALNWLQELGIKSIMVKEEEGGAVRGRAGYK